MRIVIAGAGTVGRHLAARLVREGHEVVLIDQDQQKLRQLEEFYDLKAVAEDATDAERLSEILTHDTQLLVAVTDSDATNVLICHLGRRIVENLHGERLPTIARLKSSRCFASPSFLDAEDVGIDQPLYPELEAATHIAGLLRRPYADNRSTFLHDKLEVIEMKLHEGQKIVGMPIAKLRECSERSFLIACVSRKVEVGGDVQELVSVPVDSTELLHAGDSIHVAARPEELDDVAADLGFPVNRVRKIFLSGGTRIGLEVARLLEKEIRIFLIEPDRNRAKELANELQGTIVLHGEGTDSSLLTGEGIADADCFAAVSSDENTNLLSCLLAKKLGVKRTLALMAKPDFVKLVDELNVDMLVSQRLMTINRILYFVRKGSVVQVDELVEDRIQAIVYRVGINTDVTGEALSSEKMRRAFPRGALVGAIYRAGDIEVASGQTALMPDDEVLVFAPSEAVKAIEAFFA